ncbi:hypothetical protein [Mucilaginibacter psychrotolerans]|uniref:Uncharacterized protein n=1 Tax=Mucilaginibacter psychrotolerans TaxID=1524096 RepID=A0A4Y8S2Z4_9SPHI|nr:hypothetical protein [Mucilaginibacter psychrotolerans]TFF33378.1 hypothetical protein E2R66_26330 [Mucilaginibacter psychrotolerans]
MTDKRVNVQASFNAFFRSQLEYRLTYAFGNLDDNILKYFWCDGIYEPLINVDFTSRNITSIKKITTWAWIGTKGEHQYIMIIKLGRRSRRRALKGSDLSDCMPEADKFDWVDIDVVNQVITLQLE